LFIVFSGDDYYTCVANQSAPTVRSIYQPIYEILINLLDIMAHRKMNCRNVLRVQYLIL
jgi:hypothetical protein